MPLAFGAVAPFAGRTADHLGARVPTLLAMLLAAASLAVLALLHPAGAALLLPLAGLGAGLGVFTPANNAAIMIVVFLVFRVRAHRAGHRRPVLR